MITYDLVVIGGGPGGYVAAQRASELGMKTAIVEKETLGGVCVNVGCIPTKSLLKNAEIARLVNKDARTFGLAFDNATLDYGAAVDRSRKVSERLSKGVALLMKKGGIDVYNGIGSLRDETTVIVRDPAGETIAELKTQYIILATGTRPATIAGIEYDGDRILNYRQAILRRELPGSIIVIGGGALGVEFASVWASYGSNVTVVEMMPQLVPGDDADAAAELARQFKRRGIKVLVNHKLKNAVQTETGVEVTVETDNKDVTLSADQVLIAIGFRPNTDELNLQNAGVSLTSRGWIETDGFGQTNVDNIFAIGDVSGKIQLAHVASALGRIAVEMIAGKNPAPYNPDHIPHATYSVPQVAAVGLTAAEAEKRGHRVIVGRSDFIANGKAIGLDDYAGFAKIVCDADTGAVLGGTVVGPEGSELLAEIGLAVRCGLTVDAIGNNIHAHPTLCETVMEAAQAAMLEMEKEK